LTYIDNQHIHVCPDFFKGDSLAFTLRNFLKASGAGLGGLMLWNLTRPSVTQARPFPFIPLMKIIGLLAYRGYVGLSKGDSANSLTPHIGDANALIPEFKAFLVDVRKS
jgi:hypothetical protein